MLDGKKVGEIKRLFLDGYTEREIAEIAGVNRKTARRIRQLYNLPKPERKTKIYSVSIKKTGQDIFTGTAKQCAAFLGIKVESFRSAKSRATTYIIEVV